MENNTRHECKNCKYSGQSAMIYCRLQAHEVRQPTPTLGQLGEKPECHISEPTPCKFYKKKWWKK